MTTSTVHVTGVGSPKFPNSIKDDPDFFGIEIEFKNCFMSDPCAEKMWQQFADNVETFSNKYPSERVKLESNLSTLKQALSKISIFEESREKNELLGRLLVQVNALPVDKLRGFEIQSFHEAFTSAIVQVQTEREEILQSYTTQQLSLKVSSGSHLLDIVLRLKAEKLATCLLNRGTHLTTERVIFKAIETECWKLASYCLAQSDYKVFQVGTNHSGHSSDGTPPAKVSSELDFPNSQILFELINHYDFSDDAFEFAKAFIPVIPIEFVTVRLNERQLTPVRLASAKNNLDLFKELLLRNPEALYVPNPEGIPLLHSLILKGRDCINYFEVIIEVEKQLQNDWCMTTEPPRLKSDLIQHTYDRANGQKGQSEYLNLEFVEPDYQRESQDSLAVVATQSFQINWLTLTQDGKNDSLMHFALRRRKMDVLSELQQIESCPNWMSNGEGDTVLHTAIKDGCVTEAAKIMGYGGVGREAGKCRDVALRDQLCRYTNREKKTPIDLMKDPKHKRDNLLLLVKK